jgi:hypothetical protein
MFLIAIAFNSAKAGQRIDFAARFQVRGTGDDSLWFYIDDDSPLSIQRSFQKAISAMKGGDLA